MTLDESAGFGMERLILDQVAEKDLLHRADSRVYIEGDGPDQIKVSIIVFQRDQASFLVQYVSFIFFKDPSGLSPDKASFTNYTSRGYHFPLYRIRDKNINSKKER